MRTLDLDEISSKISDYASDIRYSDRNHLEIKITQFLNFLNEQPISKRTLERIGEDFREINEKRVAVKGVYVRDKVKRDFIELLTTREIQGAFAYFEINEKFEEVRKNTNHYIKVASDWYTTAMDYDSKKEDFINLFFDPFVEILEWYFRESKIGHDVDYYSHEEIARFDTRFDTLETEIIKLGLGQEIIFNEADEIKELLKGLNKKNLVEIIKGKFIDMAIKGVISMDNAEVIIKTLTGQDIKLN